MKAEICFGAILLAVMIPSAFAQSVLTEEDWIPLENEPSRQELFQFSNDEFGAEAIQPQFIFPQDTLIDSANKAPRKNSIFGIDISHYNKTGLPFDQLSAKNIRFVYAKATQGIQNKDAKFGGYWKAMEALPAEKRVLRGAYHFLSSAVSNDPVQQAERFVAYVNLQGGFKASDMSPAMDLEWDKACTKCPDGWQSRTQKEIVSAALAFLNRVEELTGKTPILYTSRSWWRERGVPEAEVAKLAHFPIWVADYSRSSLNGEIPGVPNNTKPGLWQFSESAKLSGKYSDPVDGNIFKGSEAEFLATFFGAR